MLYASYFQPFHFSTPLAAVVPSSSHDADSVVVPVDGLDDIDNSDIQATSSQPVDDECMLKHHIKGKSMEKPVLGERRQRASKVDDDSLSVQEMQRLLVETRQTLHVIQAEHTSLRVLLECIVYNTSPPPRFRGPSQDPISIRTRPVHDKSNSKKRISSESESDGCAGSYTTSDSYSDKEAERPVRYVQPKARDQDTQLNHGF
ncbi:hypothetical protein BJ165DRAFT_1407864 [Panaeolus papilionaceus]|nr:hypothetical protein BJ165DRAFT_1407864 [Panaeolus papilionaceus]